MIPIFYQIRHDDFYVSQQDVYVYTVPDMPKIKRIVYWYRNDYPRLPIIATHVISRFFVWTTMQICIYYEQISYISLGSMQSNFKNQYINMPFMVKWSA